MALNSSKAKAKFAVSFLSLTVVFFASAALADKVCLKATVKGSAVTFTKKTAASSGKCPKGFAELLDSATTSSGSGAAGARGDIGAQGPVGAAGASGATGATGATGSTGSTGATGATGADGQLKIYGNGSAGSVTISSNKNWGSSTDAPSNFAFTDLTIDVGRTLVVPSGTTVRCTGQFNNNGTIVISNGSNGSEMSTTDNASLLANSLAVANPGIASRSSGSSEYASVDSVALKGGIAGTALPYYSLRNLVNPGLYGGSGGGAAGSDSFTVGSTVISTNTGGSGGGSFRVLAQNGVFNNGVISANGTGDNGGGGGGGVIVLASKTTVFLSGGSIITADGGMGEAADSNEAASGGGGGGLVQILAPTIVELSGAITSVSGGTGGAAGANGTIVSAGALEYSGGGGGASGGAGGSGAGKNSAGGSTSGNSGSDGFYVKTQVDPTSWF